MEIPPEIRAQLLEKIWMPYKFRTGLRQLRALRAERKEGRGRPEQFDDEYFIRVYVEIEARARLLTRGYVLRLLHHPKLRLDADDAKPERLNRQDRQRLRRQHAEGQREALEWCKIKFMHREHPKWFEIQHQIEKRMSELRTSEELFFLKLV